MKSRVRHTSGFTLTELLVVIGIIALLASIIIAGSASSRKTSRDARRIADIGQISVALESYYASNQAYPTTGGAWFSLCDGTHTATGATGYVPGLATTYIGVLPRDPSGCPSAAGLFQGYGYRSDGTNYKVAAIAEIGVECASGKSYYDQGNHDIKFCSVYTPAAAAW